MVWDRAKALEDQDQGLCLRRMLAASLAAGVISYTVRRAISAESSGVGSKGY